MDKIIGIFTKSGGDVKRDDDVVDRLSHRYTVILIIAFTIVISATLYVGKPIECWCDKHFTGNHIKYTNAYCWVRNTYYLPFEDEIPKEHETEGRHEILYYQWLPFILLAQAFFFYAPSAVWHGLNQKAGVDCDNILATAAKMLRESSPTKRGEIMGVIVQQMDRFLCSRREVAGSKMCTAACVRQTLVCCGSRMGNYLVMLYMFAKVLYLVNVVAQLYLLNIVLSTSFGLYGYEFLANVADGEHWMTSPAFPRVTMCDFHVRRLGNVHRYTVQCVLPINMYTEKIYAFLWFWMVFVAVVTGVNLVLWVLRLASASDRLTYLTTHIPATRNSSKDSHGHSVVRRFMDQYLRQDGVFVLRLIGHNTNNITVTDITERLFDYWKQKKDVMLDDDDDDEPSSPTAPVLPPDHEAPSLPRKPPLPPKPELPHAPVYPALPT